MSCFHPLCADTGSTLNPTIFALRFANSGCRPAMYPSSVVHTGVKSFGCENKTAQPSPIHSWKLILPCVVSAVKFGASSFMRNDIVFPSVLFMAMLQYTPTSESDTIARDETGCRFVPLDFDCHRPCMCPNENAGPDCATDLWLSGGAYL